MIYGKSIVRNALFLITALFIAALWAARGGPSIALLYDVIGKDLGVAAICCAAIFVIKGFVPFIPSAVANLICGCLLPAGFAFGACVFGTVYIFTLGYFEGIKTDSVALGAEINGFLSSLFMHSVRFIPCRTAGYYLGRLRAGYFGGMLGAVLGSLPSIMLTLSVSLGLEIR